MQKIYTDVPMLSSLISKLESEGRYYFSFNELQLRSNLSPEALRSALYRLKRKKNIAMPMRGFYVILPPKYRSRGCLPAEQFVPGMMQYHDQTYYAGLLTAAAYYGASHQRPQVFQVVVAKPRRKITCGAVAVEFIVRKNAHEIPVQERNTPAGFLRVSTPEATAFDLVGHAAKCGGLDNVATLLGELSASLNAEKLLETAKLSPVSWLQRLGYLLDLVGDSDLSRPLAGLVAEKKPVNAFLLPSSRTTGAKINSRWRLLVNTLVEPES